MNKVVNQLMNEFEFRVITESVSDRDGHTTRMETVMHHSEDEDDSLRESMQNIIDEFMSDSKH